MKPNRSIEYHARQAENFNGLLDWPQSATSNTNPIIAVNFITLNLP
jgi:hypothetical protein